MGIIALLGIAFVVCLIIRWFPAVDKPWRGFRRPMVEISLEPVPANPNAEMLVDRKCPVCGAVAKIQFTQGKGRPYFSCDEHRVHALLLGCHQRGYVVVAKQ